METSSTCLQCGGSLSARNQSGYCQRTKACVAARVRTCYRSKTAGKPKQSCEICGTELWHRRDGLRFCSEHLNAGKRIKRAEVKRRKAKLEASKFGPFAEALAWWAKKHKGFRLCPVEVVVLGMIHEHRTRPWPVAGEVKAFMDGAAPLLKEMGVQVTESTRTGKPDGDVEAEPVVVWELLAL